MKIHVLVIGLVISSVNVFSGHCRSYTKSAKNSALTSPTNFSRSAYFINIGFDQVMNSKPRLHPNESGFDSWTAKRWLSSMDLAFNYALKRVSPTFESALHEIFDTKSRNQNNLNSFLKLKLQLANSLPDDVKTDNFVKKYLVFYFRNAMLFSEAVLNIESLAEDIHMDNKVIIAENAGEFLFPIAKLATLSKEKRANYLKILSENEACLYGLIYSPYLDSCEIGIRRDCWEVTGALIKQLKTLEKTMK